MWFRILATALALTLGAGTALASPNPDKMHEAYDWRHRKDKQDKRTAELRIGIAVGTALTGLTPQSESLESDAGDGAAATVATSRVTVFPINNLGATLQPDEPTENGLMTRTLWAAFKAPDAARIVVSTFGSEIDTVLAAYRGADLLSQVRLTGNDNTPLPVLGGKASLIQFNTTANTDYAIQIGSRANAQGEISLNVFKFPPAGGLGALLFQRDGNAFNGRSYSCDVYAGTTFPCPAAKFILYNSTDKAVTVTPSTTLGAGVTTAGPFSLGSRKLALVDFKFGPGVTANVRTRVGKFVFTGRAGGQVVAQATARAIIIARPGAIIDDMVRAQVTPTLQAGWLNEPFVFKAKLTNTSTTTAVGCHFRSRTGSYVRSSFYEVNPANGARISADDVPVDLAAGKTRSFVVTIGSQTARDGDHIDPDVIADCANNARRVSPLRGGFDISTSGYEARLPSLSVTSSVPSNDILTIPKGGYRYYSFRVTNTQTTRLLDVLPAYVGPYDDPANRKFSVAICRTDLSTGKCLAPFASSMTYNAKRTGVFGFAVRVKTPTVAPAFDPDNRRVYVNFKLSEAPYFRIAAPSIAVRAQ